MTLETSRAHGHTCVIPPPHPRGKGFRSAGSDVSSTLGHVTADGDLRSRLRAFFGYGGSDDSDDDPKPRRLRFLI